MPNANHSARELIYARDMPHPRSNATEEELQEAARRLLPDAQEIAGLLARLRYTGNQVEEAFQVVLQRALQDTLAAVAGDYVIEHLATLLPAAVDRVLESEWDAYVDGRRVRETLRGCVLRKVEEAVQRDVAARYEIDVAVTFRKKA